MYNKHTHGKIEYQVVIDNKVIAEFNTKRKRDAFLKKTGTRSVTCLSTVSYSWNAQDGVHNLKTPNDIAKISGCDPEKVRRAIRNGEIKSELLGGERYVVEKMVTVK